MGRFHAHRPYKLAGKKSMGFNWGEITRGYISAP